MLSDLIPDKQPLLLVGCGKMGGALLQGWLELGIEGSKIFVVEPQSKELEAIRKKGVHIVAHPDALPKDLSPLLVLLAIKPQFMDEALAPYRRFAGPSTLFLSIAAGKNLDYLRNKLGEDAKILRAMPNTPASVRRGMSVILRSPGIEKKNLDLCEKLLNAVGKVAWIQSEEEIDAVTALSGGGPAYVFLLIEALAKAGEKLGLHPDLAMTLARETVCGAGELAYRSQETAEALRNAVTSPKGTTLEALKILMAENGLQPLIERALKAAVERSKEIATNL